MKSRPFSFSKRSLAVVVLFLIICGFALFGTRPILKKETQGDTSKSLLVLQDGLEISNVGHFPKLLRDFETPQKIRLLLIEAMPCEACDVDPHAVLYHVKSRQNLTFDLPGSYFHNGDPEEGRRPYFEAQLFLGTCGQPAYGIWSYSHSFDENTFQRTSFLVQPDGLSHKNDVMTEEVFNSETQKLAKMQDCEAFPKREFSSM